MDRVAVLDWSSSGVPKLGKDSIWLGLAQNGQVQAENHATRTAAYQALHQLVAETLAAGETLLLGVDFSLGYPQGFGQALMGDDSPFAVWGWMADHITDSHSNAHNLRMVAAQANAAFAGDGPFWGNGAKADIPGLPRKKPRLAAGLAEFRATEQAARKTGLRPKSCWQLAGAGAVGAQAMVGLHWLEKLRQAFAGQVAVWPFEQPTAPIVIVEVYPALFDQDVAAAMAQDRNMVRDALQVKILAQALHGLAAAGQLGPLFAQPHPLAQQEGWIFGLGHEIALRAALPARVLPPRLRDDCFAMPQGVNGVPVDQALARLRAALHPVTGTETCPTHAAHGRVLAQACVARRSNPPMPNAAVDGYGFAHAATGDGPQRLPLVAGRAAAGQPFQGVVPPGAAVRILTGAILPDGVDTVVLEEDTAIDGAAVVFDGPVKPGANTRKAGEDVAQGAPALPIGAKLRAPDLALLSALGLAQVSVYRRLRVGVLSTGDEIISSPAQPALPHQIYDANRPMLLALAQSWGYQPVDLGHAPDDPEVIRQRLNQGAKEADVIFTSGGASAGDEDHVSALLRASGTLSSWRIALKPGRPLVLAMWQGVPVMGLPGNPVAALVCALIFGRPALSLLAGAGWAQPQGFWVPAAFRKAKKPGRREYLRARLNADGAAEVFQSEGSGRISGLSWAEGLVELPDAAIDVGPGTMVRFLPYAGFGL